MAAGREDHFAAHVERLVHDIGEAERLRSEGVAAPGLPPTLDARLHLLRRPPPGAEALLDRPGEAGATLRQLIGLRVADAGGCADFVDAAKLDDADRAIGPDADVAAAIARELARPA